MLQPIMEGARKAFKYHKGTPACPKGHGLKATVAPAGITCVCCRRKTEEPKVVIICVKGDRCGFVTCACKVGCAPTPMVRVMKALYGKHDKRESGHQKIMAGELRSARQEDREEAL